MNAATYVVIIAAVSMATYLTRYPSLLLGRRLRVTPRIRQGLNFIPIGVFAAMVAPTVAAHAGIAGAIDYAFLTAVCVSVVTAVITKNPLWTMLLGVAAVALCRLL